MIDGPKSKRVIISLLLFAAVIPCNVGDVHGAETGPSEPFDPTWTPEVVYDDNPGLVEFYWKAWDLAWDHVHTDTTAPTSPFMDEAFSNGDIWIWDTCFMGLFCKYAPDRFPGVQSFENFYKVFHDGITSSQTIWHPDNPPLFAWVEWQNYKFTNDLSRLQWLLEDTQYLQKHFAFFENSVWGQSIPGAANGMALERSLDDIGYWWRGVSSGMDNSPRGRNFTVYWIDAISQQALSAFFISKMAEEIGNTAIRDEYLAHYNSFVNLLNTHYWDSQDNFYYDIKEYTHEFSNIKTMASYWPLLAEAADVTQAQHMAGYASDPQTFGGLVAFPALARNDQDFDPTGRYWRGGMWLPTAYMGVKSLENYGLYTEADAAARSIVDHMYNTFISYSPATIWECYSPTEAKPATLVSGTGESRPDFCGWSALGPISLFIENYLGFHTVDAQADRVQWRKYQTGRHGIRNLKFGNITTHIVGNSDSFTVWSSGPYTLAVNGTDYAIAAGEQSWGPNPPILDSTPGTWPPPPPEPVPAVDDFSYADGALAGNNGGTGWAGPWTDNAGTPATVVGGVAQTSFTGAGSSQIQRDLSSAMSSAWIRATVQKTATLGISESYGGIGLYDGGTERALIGNFWPGVAADAWGAGTNGSQGEIAGELVTTLSDVIVYVDGTETKLWVNPADPANLGVPEATGGGVGQFNRIILRCGTSTAGTETWQFDNLIVGETLSDITPPPCAGVKFDGDIDGDCFADITDLLLLVQEWMSVSVITDADINEDTKVDLVDFSYIGRDWLVP
jgi:hypothetical protein